ncbi:MAG: serine/threonine-protein kinase [Acidimicrobiales bacterium]
MSKTTGREPGPVQVAPTTDSGDPARAAVTRRADVLGGRYRLIRVLGHGGMSDVYEATDGERHTTVAVKIVRSADAGLARRLAQEARALSRLDHPGLVRLLDTGMAHGQAYLVMELVSGSTLAESLRTGAQGPARTADIGVELAGALAYVHGQGIVHRDVKPSNILMGAAGGAKLGDFGIARLADASTLTLAGTTLGTAAYMAPSNSRITRWGRGRMCGHSASSCSSASPGDGSTKGHRARWWLGVWPDRFPFRATFLSPGGCS